MPGLIELDCEPALGSALTLTGAHLCALLHWGPRPGEAFTIKAGLALYRARLLSLDDTSAGLLVYEKAGAPSPPHEITLLQALPERQRVELIVQKATELGAAAIRTFTSKRSISIEELDSRQRRSHNWGAIALKAARQSRRADIPEVGHLKDMEGALKTAEGAGLRLLLSERQGAAAFRDAVAGAKGKGPVKAALIAGPEGGLTDEEEAEARAAGFKAVSLGPRVLRTETAAILGVGLLAYELGL